MPANTILIEGSFEELCTELTQYIDQTNKASGSESNLEAEVAPLLKEEKKEDALKKVITASSALNNAPERGTTGKTRINKERGLTQTKNSSPHTTFLFTLYDNHQTQTSSSRNCARTFHNPSHPLHTTALASL